MWIRRLFSICSDDVSRLHLPLETFRFKKLMQFPSSKYRDERRPELERRFLLRKHWSSRRAGGGAARRTAAGPISTFMHSWAASLVSWHLAAGITASYFLGSTTDRFLDEPLCRASAWSAPSQFARRLSNFSSEELVEKPAAASRGTNRTGAGRFIRIGFINPINYPQFSTNGSRNGILRPSHLSLWRTGDDVAPAVSFCSSLQHIL